jgi:rfaE bifunctional protein nucleotidyltransferase chain/domain
MGKIVWTNGCFDILHKGHIELFKYAKSFGDKLFIGIDSDEKVKKDKGNDRPFNNVKDRREVLEAIKYIDGVFIFNDTQGLDDLIRVVGPDIMVIGSDWKGKTVVGEQHVNKLVFFDRLKNYSTTNILEWKNQ